MKLTGLAALPVMVTSLICVPYFSCQGVIVYYTFPVARGCDPRVFKSVRKLGSDTRG